MPCGERGVWVSVSVCAVSQQGPGRNVLCYCAVWPCVVFCYVVLCWVVLCCVMMCYVVLCCVVVVVVGIVVLFCGSSSCCYHIVAEDVGAEDG